MPQLLDPNFRGTLSYICEHDALGAMAITINRPSDIMLYELLEQLEIPVTADNIQAKNRKYMFEMIENFNNREYVDTSNENITIEHIFPRNPHVKWNTELKPESSLNYEAGLDQEFFGGYTQVSARSDSFAYWHC